MENYSLQILILFQGNMKSSPKNFMSRFFWLYWYPRDRYYHRLFISL